MEESAYSQTVPAPHAMSPMRLSRGRWLRIGEWLLFALLVAHYCVRTLPSAWRTLNNDFQDYYLTANLVHEHFDTSRVYEWIWLERQKDHRAIDPQVVNLTPSTAFSTLVLYPFAGMPALTAKRCWLVCNFGLLVVTIFLLRGLTQLPVRRIALLAALSFPLRTNFAAGQYYVLLLFMLTLACYLYLRQRRFLAGVAIGISSGMKIFPILYLLYFLRKRDWKAGAGGVVGGLGAVVVSVLVFGREMNRTYFFQVLPSTLRGEALATYTLKIASLSSLLHRLFIYEPQWNPHPAINAAWLFAILHPMLQWLVMAPALLLAIPHDRSPRRVRLEWAAVLVASLAISTSPQSYLFTLLILPACLIFEALESKSAYRSMVLLVLLYMAVGYLSGSERALDGWYALLGVPRFYAMLLASVLVYLLLIRRYPAQNSKRGLGRDRYAWAVALVAVVAVSMVGNLRHQRGLYDDYQWRIATPKEAYMAIHPTVQGNAVAFIAMQGNGYRVGLERDGLTQFINMGNGEPLAVTSFRGKLWTEQAGKESTVLSQIASEEAIPRAESPVASFDGRWLAYLREDRGRARMWIHALEKKGQTGSDDQPVTPADLNVLEMSFLPNGDVVFAATSVGQPRLFLLNRLGGIQPLGVEEARYPAVSPDGHWLAYSQLQGGNWNLWLRDMNGGTTQRITHAACNATEPAWEADSKTLLYASDCGRTLNFSALCRRQVIP